MDLELVSVILIYVFEFGFDFVFHFIMLSKPGINFMIIPVSMTLRLIELVSHLYPSLNYPLNTFTCLCLDIRIINFWGVNTFFGQHICRVKNVKNVFFLHILWIIIFLDNTFIGVIKRVKRLFKKTVINLGGSSTRKGYCQM